MLRFHKKKKQTEAETKVNNKRMNIIFITFFKLPNPIVLCVLDSLLQH